MTQPNLPRIFSAYLGCECTVFVHPENCKLRLTPLSKISDADVLEIARIAEIRHYTTEGKIHHVKEFVSKYWNRSINTTPREMVEIIDFLRSSGYDCGYGSIPSLISAGIAVDKTQTT